MSEPRCTGEKKCNKCGDLKHVLAFSVDRTRADGLRHECRDCEGDESRKRRPPGISSWFESAIA
jgi:hypothetical protein